MALALGYEFRNLYGANIPDPVTVFGLTTGNKGLITKGLTRAERLILILYYYEEMTMKEIGSTLDLSESRVSQMHSSIIMRLKGHLEMRRKEFGAD